MDETDGLRKAFVFAVLSLGSIQAVHRHAYMENKETFSIDFSKFSLSPLLLRQQAFQVVSAKVLQLHHISSVVDHPLDAPFSSTCRSLLVQIRSLMNCCGAAVNRACLVAQRAG